MWSDNNPVVFGALTEDFSHLHKQVYFMQDNAPFIEQHIEYRTFYSIFIHQERCYVLDEIKASAEYLQRVKELLAALKAWPVQRDLLEAYDKLLSYGIQRHTQDVTIYTVHNIYGTSDTQRVLAPREAEEIVRSSYNTLMKFEKRFAASLGYDTAKHASEDPRVQHMISHYTVETLQELLSKARNMVGGVLMVQFDELRLCIEESDPDILFSELQQHIDTYAAQLYHYIFAKVYEAFCMMDASHHDLPLEWGLWTIVEDTMDRDALSQYAQRLQVEYMKEHCTPSRM